MKKSKEKQGCKGAKRLTKSTRDAQMSDGILRLGRFGHSIMERVYQLSCFVEMLMNETGSNKEEKEMKREGESRKEEVGMKGTEDMRWYGMGSNGDGSRVKAISALRTNRGGIE